MKYKLLQQFFKSTLPTAVKFLHKSNLELIGHNGHLGRFFKYYKEKVDTKEDSLTFKALLEILKVEEE